MLYEIRIARTRRQIGVFEGSDPCEALAAMLVRRGISSGSGALLARVLDGLEAVPVDVLRAFALAGYADGVSACAARDGDHERAARYAFEAGRQRGIAFRVAERAAR